MAINSHRLLDRLQRDLAELREQPYPGVAVFIDDADFQRICLVLTPPAGPWKGLALHFDVRLPPTWPRDPPSVSSTHSINHPNLRAGGGICCDLLRPHSGQGYTGGYSPALTLRGFFLQFLTFFSSTSVEQEGGRPAQLGDATVTTYITERDLATASTPWELGHQDGPLTSEFLQGQQRDLEYRWKADFRHETQGELATSDGHVNHKIKGTYPDRIHRFEKRTRRWLQAYSSISGWSCKRCPYGSLDLPLDAPTANFSMKDASTMLVEPSDLYLVPPLTCVLHLLNDDILLEIASHLPSESLITFGQAYLRFQNLMTGHHILLLHELQCFFLKTPLSQAILGTGVAFDEVSMTLSSDFDWLSQEAFEKHRIRKSILKRDFRFFLPLAFNQSHFERAKEAIWSRVASIDTAVRQANECLRLTANGGHGDRAQQIGPRDQPHQAFTVLYKMMNDIVVSLMQTCDDALVPQDRRSHPRPDLLTASERAVISYCHLMHLLICVCRAEPRLLQDAQERARDFLQVPAIRTHVSTRDMGELIVVVTLSLIMSGSPSSWDAINGPFLEAIMRNVRRILTEAPGLDVMEGGASEDRLVKTFARSRMTLRLIMFQVTFLDLFIETYRAIGIEALDRTYGFPESGLPEKMVEEIKAIYRVNSWDEFFAKVQYRKLTAQEFMNGIVYWCGEHEGTQEPYAFEVAVDPV